MPILLNSPPIATKNVVAEQIMSQDLVTLQIVESVEVIYEKLSKCEHHTIPLLNSHGLFVGLIPRNFLITLILKLGFYQGADTQPADFDASESFKERKYEEMQQKNLTMKHQLLRDQTKNISQLKRQKSFSFQKSNYIIVNYADFMDVEKFPETPDSKILPWQLFTRDFWSNDLKMDDKVETICKVYKSELIDLRPYIIENPVMVYSTDYISKCLDYFRKMHVR
mmetsp:Transcript_6445/g.10941  ORF Transcript_6445/g.10941 Transcript_6445/m.10941 type:complete len:224 (-) Transcript_6445:51-722(-)